MTKNKDTHFDIIVIGAGPGGYVCAIRAAQLGMKVACVEKRDSLGGTCLNIGCIPSKALLQASEKFQDARDHMVEMGIKAKGVELDLKGMMKHKTDVVDANTKGIEFLFKKNKVEWLKGAAKFKDSGTIAVGQGKKEQTYTADNIVIATGSDVAGLPNIKIDEKKIVSSTGALELTKVPKTMVVIGGGYIGLEMGAVWSRLGAKVTVVEFADRILPGMDTDLSKEMMKILKKEGMEFRLETKVTSAKAGAKDVQLEIEPASGGKAEKLKADIVLVAVGRKAYTNALALDKAGVEVNDRGQVVTDETFETSADGVFAIGDVIDGPMLAHKAEEEGVALAEMLAGEHGHVNYDVIPGVVYTYPEIATVGKTEEQLKEEGVKYKTGKFPFLANGRARAMNATDGFVKILTDAATDRILGAHIIGAEAGTMIAELALAMEFDGTAEDVFRTCHPHPTLEEAVKEAALASHGRALHS